MRAGRPVVLAASSVASKTSATNIFRRLVTAYLDAVPEKRLALAVLQRAFDDLIVRQSVNGGPESGFASARTVYAYRAEVSEWLASEEFVFWCDVADIRPEIVRRWFEVRVTERGGAQAWVLAADVARRQIIESSEVEEG